MPWEEFSGKIAFDFGVLVEGLRQIWWHRMLYFWEAHLRLLRRRCHIGGGSFEGLARVHGVGSSWV
jgi:hypothetical protein